MKPKKRLAALLLGLCVALGLSGCDILPSTDFDDYDVSGYIQALMDSSYHNSHTSFIQMTQAEEATARDNNSTTVQNISTLFCNAYGLSPNNDQMARLQEIIGNALLSSRYTVKDEVKISTGYTISVEITPMRNLVGLEDEFSQLRQQATDEANRANAPAYSNDGQDQEEDEDGWDDQWGYEEEPTPEPTATPVPDKVVDSYELYIDKVLEVLPGKLQTPDYQAETVVIALDIRQTEVGDLQLDLNQIDTIDQTVMLFS